MANLTKVFPAAFFELRLGLRQEGSAGFFVMTEVMPGLMVWASMGGGGWATSGPGLKPI